eukprot:g2511.t1
MYLLLSIAAADLWAGCALCKEGRDSGAHDYWGRKLFGLCLVGTFLALIGASIRVLFYSSFENVELVIGAAAVLFIADVDEKAMGVLKNVTGRWRLFWVLESIGLSMFLAVFSIKVTGNSALVDKDDGQSFGDDYCRNVGTLLWEEEGAKYGVAFWAAVTIVSDTVIDCAQIWIRAFLDGTVT